MINSSGQFLSLPLGGATLNHGPALKLKPAPLPPATHITSGNPFHSWGTEALSFDESDETAGGQSGASVFKCGCKNPRRSITMGRGRREIERQVVIRRMLEWRGGRILQKREILRLQPFLLHFQRINVV